MNKLVEPSKVTESSGSIEIQSDSSINVFFKSLLFMTDVNVDVAFLDVIITVNNTTNFNCKNASGLINNNYV